MDIIFGELGLEIIEFVQSIGGAWLDIVFSLITKLGESFIYIIVICILYWVKDKQMGIKLFYLLLTANYCIECFKGIFGILRPYQEVSSKSIRRIATAPGYSFPSGHSTSAMAIYSSIAHLKKQASVTIVCIVIIMLVGLSRIRLAVHWPGDVLGGFVLGIVIYLFYWAYYQEIYQFFSRIKFEMQMILIIGISILLLLFSLIITSLCGHNLEIASTGVACGSFAGGSLAILLEQSRINIQPPISKRNAGTRVIIGLLITSISYLVGNAGMQSVYELLLSTVLYIFVEYVFYGGLTFLFLFGIPWLFKKIDI